MSETKRTNMKPEERRAQLLSVAQHLFFNKGYDDTTMADILQEAGVSKGGFYHHFESKDALFFALLDQLISQVATALEGIAADQSETVTQRMVAVLATEGQFLKRSNLEPQMQIINVMQAEKNIGMSARFDRMIREMMAPIVTGLIQEGVKTGEFKVHDPEAAALVILHMIRAFEPLQTVVYRYRNTSEAAEHGDRLRNVLTQQFIGVDLILGVPLGTTSYGWPGLVDAIMALPQKPV
ncbi:TetR/AcrR family transcriptional regulator [Aestuariibius sp. HNIBRBA575]|uniref:TetR/AcrR family transcriptional regulator n=1 Tax=Aestuariibius sp. HNIBRBA575 TaxID=3233343 RepID=UPI0034A3A7B9